MFLLKLRRLYTAFNAHDWQAFAVALGEIILFIAEQQGATFAASPDETAELAAVLAECEGCCAPGAGAAVSDETWVELFKVVLSLIRKYLLG